MDLQSLLSPFGEELPITPSEVADALDPTAVYIVLDDDPTGTQAISGLPVLTSWDAADLDWAFAKSGTAFYVLTNSRSQTVADTRSRVSEIVAGALAAAVRSGRTARFISRSDSTLRGHFPLEVSTINDTLESSGHARCDLLVLVPAFPDAGRITVGSVHYWAQDNEATPVAQTPFATDATFGFSQSELGEWALAKAAGLIGTDQLVRIPLDQVRGSATDLAETVSQAPQGSILIPDVVTENDMRAFAVALHRVEAAGRSCLIQSGPAFVRALVGQTQPTPINPEKVSFAHESGGLVIVGSHVPLSTTQLNHLMTHVPATHSIQMDVNELLGSDSSEYVAARVTEAVSALEHSCVVVHTSRNLVKGSSAEESLEIARTVSAALISFVQQVFAQRPPRFVIAKGGITSSDTATHGLGITRALVAGPLFDGIVSLWEPRTGPAVGVPYVVFAGNVGAESSLSEAVTMLMPPASEPEHI